MKAALVWLLAIIFAAAVVVLELWVGEIALTALLLFAATITLGSAVPRHAWRWGLLGLMVPLAHSLARLFPAWPEAGFNRFWLALALVPAFVGAYAGAAFRTMARNLLSDR